VKTMGTDCYLNWTGKRKTDWDKQYKGFTINGGKDGYLRASIGMVNENTVLRLLFHARYWDKESRAPYDFKGNFELMQKLLNAYLSGKIDEQLVDGMIERKNANLQMMENLATLFNTDNIRMSGSDDAKFKQTWANSVIEFFKYAIKKQEKGLRPYPYISW
jgi:hypothetical protein